MNKLALIDLLDGYQFLDGGVNSKMYAAFHDLVYSVFGGKEAINFVSLTGAIGDGFYVADKEDWSAWLKHLKETL